MSRRITKHFALLMQLNKLMELLLDSNDILLQTGSNNKTSHGLLFYATFKAVINSHLVSVCSDVVSCLTASDKLLKERSTVVGTVVIGMLDAVGRDSQLRHKQVKLYLMLHVYMLHFCSHVAFYPPYTCSFTVLYGRQVTVNYEASKWT